MGVSSDAVFELKSPGWENIKTVKSFLIPSDLPHQLSLSGSEKVLMIWLDPEFRIHRSIIKPKDIQFPFHELENELIDYSKERLSCENAEKVREIVTGTELLEKQENIDHRILSAIEWINQHLTEQTITTEHLADMVYLSSSRFMHLFSEQIGIPVRKYILWQRLRYALIQLSQGITITESSHAAGFTDSSHMNRSFNAMFGITPSKIFKNSRFIQVLPC
jgi:AraC-like DNA-binding protein